MLKKTIVAGICLIMTQVFAEFNVTSIETPQERMEMHIAAEELGGALAGYLFFNELAESRGMNDDGTFCREKNHDKIYSGTDCEKLPVSKRVSANFSDFSGVRIANLKGLIDAFIKFFPQDEFLNSYKGAYARITLRLEEQFSIENLYIFVAHFVPEAKMSNLFEIIVPDESSNLEENKFILYILERFMKANITSSVSPDR